MSLDNFNLDVFQETKVAGGAYARESSGYCVAATEAPILHSVRVMVFYFKAGGFTLELI